MKVNAEVLNNFLDGITLLGDSNDTSIKDCILRGTTEKLAVIAVTPSKTIILGAELKGDFSELGEVGVDSLPLFKKMVSTCKGEIELSRTTNKLNIKSGKKLKASLGLRNVQYVQNDLDKSKFDVLYTKATGNAFTLSKEAIEEFKKYHAVFGKDIFVTGDGNSVSFDMDSGENSLELSIDVPETVTKFKVKLSGMIVRLFGLIKSDDTKMSVNDGATVVLIETKTDDYVVKYLTAPMVK